MDTPRHVIGKMLTVIVLAGLPLAWLMQTSIATYWQETRHRDLGLPEWASPGWWTYGTTVQQQALLARDAWQKDVTNFDDKAVTTINQIWFEPTSGQAPAAAAASAGTQPTAPLATPSAATLAPPEFTSESAPTPTHLQPVAAVNTSPTAAPAPAPSAKEATVASAPAERQATPSAPDAAIPSLRPRATSATPSLPGVPTTPVPATPATPSPAVPAPPTPPRPPLPGQEASIALQAGDAVFFVGDSMMQGVAPHLRHTLSRRHGVESIDLSKQSTGLSYAGFFNWPATVEATFAKHPNIRLMVVFLGPNDPWDLPAGRQQPYLRFKSAEWEATYRSRIQALLQTARTHGARVLWLEVPAMRNAKLSNGMAYLNTLYDAEVTQAGERFLPLNALLGNQDEPFSTHAQVGERNVRVRAEDGVHFTPAGQRLIAARVMEQLHFHTPE